MNDREFLILAAKAAGLELAWIPENPKGKFQAGSPTIDIGCAPPGSADNLMSWNPLDDNGDALQLLVKLKLLVDVRVARVIVLDGASVDLEERTASDPMAATRRAIVRAAAEIGKAMP